MGIELICIGDELLEGYTINTNAANFALVLEQKLKRVTVVGDDPDLIISAIKEALSREDVVVTSGLGPTHDDLTEKVLLDHFGNQYEKLPNPVGSASGMLFTLEGKKLIALPGVPLEFIEITKGSLRSLLQTQKIPMDEIMLALTKESEVAPRLEEICKAIPDLELGVYPHFGHITLRAKGEGRKAFIQAIEAHFSGRVFFERSIYEALHTLLLKEKKSLATAESCTGGLLAASLTKIAGASNYFLGGIVSYSNVFKEQYLHVSAQTLGSHGAVSREVVIEMAKGALKNVDYAIAISGIAGPDGGTEEKPVGTVWGAIAEKNGKVLSGLIPMGKIQTRQAIMERAASFMAGALFLWVRGGEDVLTS